MHMNRAGTRVGAPLAEQHSAGAPGTVTRPGGLSTGAAAGAGQVSAHLLHVQPGQEHRAAGLRALVVRRAVPVRVPPLWEPPLALPVPVGAGPGEDLLGQVAGRPPAHPRRCEHRGPGREDGVRAPHTRVSGLRPQGLPPRSAPPHPIPTPGPRAGLTGPPPAPRPGRARKGSFSAGGSPCLAGPGLPSSTRLPPGPLTLRPRPTPTPTLAALPVSLPPQARRPPIPPRLRSPRLRPRPSRFASPSGPPARPPSPTSPPPQTQRPRRSPRHRAPPPRHRAPPPRARPRPQQAGPAPQRPAVPPSAGASSPPASCGELGLRNLTLLKEPEQEPLIVSGTRPPCGPFPCGVNSLAGRTSGMGREGSRGCRLAETLDATRRPTAPSPHSGNHDSRAPGSRRGEIGKFSLLRSPTNGP